MSLFAVLAATALAAPALGGVERLLLVGGNVHVVPGQPPRKAALLLEGGRVSFVGDEAEARALARGAETIDLAGATVYPGLADAHGHLLGLARSAYVLDLSGKSVDEIVELVRQKAATSPSGAWIEGRGWDQNRWPDRSFPVHGPISAAAPANPVVLTRVDGHAVWANEAAMKLAGVSLTPKRKAPDPAGGKVVRDERGAPTGVFVDNAADLVTKAIPGKSKEELKKLFVEAGLRCARAGLTSVGDASGYDKAEVDALQELAAEGKLPIRVYATVGSGSSDLPWFLSRPPIKDGLLTVRAVKVYADGALGSRGAALLAPYADEPGSSGLLVTPPERLQDLVERSFTAGFQVWVHAIGDRGNRIALDAFEKAAQKLKPRDPRPRVEHAQVVSSEDVPRFARLGVIASMQPTHATSDMPWAEARLGPDRVRGAYAWKALLSSGARLCGGSDFPVESENPLLGTYAAVTRQDLSGQPAGGWRKGEALSRTEALRLFTTDVAYAEFAEFRRGTLEVGRDADLTVLDRDITTIPAAEIPKAKVVLTIVAGKKVK